MGRHYSEEFRREVVAASYVDGVSIASVARRFEVADSALYYWRKRYGRSIDEGETTVAAPSNFIPITVSPDPPASLEVEQVQSQDTWRVTISIGSDRRVEIDGAFELESLIKLVRGVSL